jgi:selenocysteine-specific elongation factor
MRGKKLILGTAGHIDHGKTALVKALTGVDTDRLQEEKARGITIDLGFAELVLKENLHLGIVDVPGHEGFIRNMLAGATGMDLVLMVISADEGIMPQTKEHLDILRLLGVHKIVVAITKSDLVEDEWLTLIGEEISKALSGTPFADAPLVRTSTVTGEGLRDLMEVLASVSYEVKERSNRDIVRLPVDRVFTVRGTGTVVTGTLWSGGLSVGDKVIIQPFGIKGRIRGLQVHGSQVNETEAGERTAVAITGSNVDLKTVERGHVLVLETGWLPTFMITVIVTVIPGIEWAIKHGQRVRVHLGTSEVMARVVMMYGEEIVPGDSGWVQLRLEKPLLARTRDRLIIRSYSPVTTIGGGIIAEAMAPKRNKLLTEEKDALLKIVDGNAADALDAILDISGWKGVSEGDIPIRTGLAQDTIKSAKITALESGARQIANEIYGSATVESARKFIENAVDDFHNKEPLRPGISVEILRQKLPTPSDSLLANLVLDEATASGMVCVNHGLVSRPGHEPSLTMEQDCLRTELLRIYLHAELTPPMVNELPERVKDDPSLWPILKLLEREGHIVSLDSDFFVNKNSITKASNKVISELKGAKGLGPIDFRKYLVVTRKHMIPILNYFDRVGLTVRKDGGREVISQSGDFDG